MTFISLIFSLSLHLCFFFHLCRICGYFCQSQNEWIFKYVVERIAYCVRNFRTCQHTLFTFRFSHSVSVFVVRSLVRLYCDRHSFCSSQAADVHSHTFVALMWLLCPFHIPSIAHEHKCTIDSFKSIDLTAFSESISLPNRCIWRIDIYKYVICYAYLLSTNIEQKARERASSYAHKFNMWFISPL